MPVASEARNIIRTVRPCQNNLFIYIFIRSRLYFAQQIFAEDYVFIKNKKRIQSSLEYFVRISITEILSVKNKETI